MSIRVFAFLAALVFGLGVVAAPAQDGGSASSEVSSSSEAAPAEGNMTSEEMPAEDMAEPANPELAAWMAGTPRKIESNEAIYNPTGLVDRPLGNPEAEVILIEYASPTCPHCASFHVNTYPSLLSDYVETGKVQFIVRPFVRNILDTVVFMLAECSDTGYYDVVDTYFANQDAWAYAQSPRSSLLTIALQKGFTEESFDACLADEALFTKLEDMRTEALEKFELEATPTFYLNGEKFSGDKSFEDMSARIDALL